MARECGSVFRQQRHCIVEDLLNHFYFNHVGEEPVGKIGEVHGDQRVLSIRFQTSVEFAEKLWATFLFYNRLGYFDVFTLTNRTDRSFNFTGQLEIRSNLLMMRDMILLWHDRMFDVKKLPLDPFIWLMIYMMTLIKCVLRWWKDNRCATSSKHCQ